MATFTKHQFFVKVVWKLFQFKKLLSLILVLDFHRLKFSVNLGVYHFKILHYISV